GIGGTALTGPRARRSRGTPPRFCPPRGWAGSPPAMRLAFRRLPIRLRLTIAFAGVLAAVLAVGGLVLFTQFRSDLDNLTGANLSSRAADAAALVASGEPRAALTRSQERLAQVYDARGRLVASTPALSHSRLLTPEQARRAARGRLRLARVQVPAGATTVSAHAAKAFGGPLAVAVAEPLDRRDQALRSEERRVGKECRSRGAP